MHPILVVTAILMVNVRRPVGWHKIAGAEPAGRLLSGSITGFDGLSGRRLLAGWDTVGCLPKD